MHEIENIENILLYSAPHNTPKSMWVQERISKFRVRLSIDIAKTKFKKGSFFLQNTLYQPIKETSIGVFGPNIHTTFISLVSTCTPPLSVWSQHHFLFGPNIQYRDICTSGSGHASHIKLKHHVLPLLRYAMARDLPSSCIEAYNECSPAS